MTIVRLDELLRRNRSLATNLEVVMKQAKGTQEEYMRQLGEKKEPAAAGPQGSAAGDSEAVAQLKRDNASLKVHACCRA